MNGLALAAPGPGYIHFPDIDDVSEEFFAQICAEHRETVYNKAKVATGIRWVQDRDDNHALDCAGLCLAGFKIMNPNVRQMHAALIAAAPAVIEARASASSSTTQAAPARRQRERRHTTPSYLR
jgi:phage terminase large subunit GpA-like protein